VPRVRAAGVLRRAGDGAVRLRDRLLVVGLLRDELLELFGSTAIVNASSAGGSSAAGGLGDGERERLAVGGLLRERDVRRPMSSSTFGASCLSR
jgi:hypothetical protein